jgi:hypothetical protein
VATGHIATRTNIAIGRIIVTTRRYPPSITIRGRATIESITINVSILVARLVIVTSICSGIALKQQVTLTRSGEEAAEDTAEEVAVTGRTYGEKTKIRSNVSAYRYILDGRRYI